MNEIEQSEGKNENRLGSDLKNYDNLLEDYSIDNESMPESEDYYSVSPSDVNESAERQQNYLQFIQAVKDDNVEFVQNFCNFKGENKELVNFKGPDGVYPIQYAILFGNIKMIETLFYFGAVFEMPLEGNPSLHLSLNFAGKLLKY